MEKFKTKMLPLNKIKANQQNPRIISESRLQKLINSLLVFPRMLSLRPIVIEGGAIILGGNMRLTALSRIAQMSEDELQARLETLPEYNDLPDGGHAVREYWQEFLNKPQAEVVIADDLSEDEKKQFIIKDNVNYGDWDYEELENWDAAKLDSWGVDTTLPDFGGQAPEGFGESQEENEKDKLDKRYSHKLGKVIYEPKESNHKICDLFKDNSKKFEAIINKIDNEELREMLKLRAAWFVDFNFEKIADYYAYQATKEEQKCIEALGLVLLDYDGLIENGFSDLLKDFENEDNH